MTELELIAVRVYNATTVAVEDNNCWTAYEKCNDLLSLIEDLKREVKTYQSYCERACENGE